jgi:hypothetical protein
MRFASWKRSFCLAVGVAFGATLASASTISYTCDPTIDSTVAGTCATLNGTIAGIYSSTFSNANAKIYITYGSIGTNLAQSLQFYTNVTYTAYANALTLDESDANDATAVGSLGGNTTNPVVASDGVALTSALATTLNLNAVAGSLGITPANASCILGTANCYNGIVTVSNVANTFYYRSGVQSGSTFDFFTAVEHETDEVLGTSSCITFNGSSVVTRIDCTNHVGANPPIGVSAPDLFRYASSGTRSYLTTASGSTAYFSINGGTTDIAKYNNTTNGADYGDWNSDSNRVQNAFGNPGSNGLNITNDGGSEIAVLDAIGYTLTSSVPEPGTGVLLAAALAVLAGLARRRAV